MAKRARSKKLTTPIARLSYPHLIEARAFEGQEAKFSCSLLFPPGTDLSGLKAAANAVAKEEWRDKRPANLRNPFRDAMEKEGTQGYDPGWSFISCSSKQRPGVVDHELKPITEEQVIYPGCWVRVTLVAFAYDVKGNRGVSFGLNNVQKVFGPNGEEGEPLGSFRKAEDDFDEVEKIEDDPVAPGTEEDMFK